MDYEKMWKKLYAEVLAHMDKYTLKKRYWYHFFRALAERMEKIEKEELEGDSLKEGKENGTEV